MGKISAVPVTCCECEWYIVENGKSYCFHANSKNVHSPHNLACEKLSFRLGNSECFALPCYSYCNCNHIVPIYCFDAFKYAKEIGLMTDYLPIHKNCYVCGDILDQSNPVLMKSFDMSMASILLVDFWESFLSLLTSKNKCLEKHIRKDSSKAFSQSTSVLTNFFETLRSRISSDYYSGLRTQEYPNGTAEVAWNRMNQIYGDLLGNGTITGVWEEYAGD